MYALRRTVDGLKPLVRMLERSSTPAVVAAALDALRAVCLNNDENKGKVNTSWLIPQLVKLMGAKVRASAVVLLLSLLPNANNGVSVVGWLRSH